MATANHDAGAAADRLGVLFDAHHQRLYRLARRMSGSADEARDLVQDTFLRAARAPESVPWGASAEEAWLVRVLVNLCRDRWRQTATSRAARSIDADDRRGAATGSGSSPRGAIRRLARARDAGPAAAGCRW